MKKDWKKRRMTEVTLGECGGQDCEEAQFRCRMSLGERQHKVYLQRMYQRDSEEIRLAFYETWGKVRRKQNDSSRQI